MSETARGQKLPRDPNDGLTLENDLLGVRLWGPPAQPTLTLGRSDIWDRRWFGDRQPLVTLERIRHLAQADRLFEIAKHPNDTAYWVYNHYPFPCPKLGGNLILGTPFARRASVVRRHDGSLSLLLAGRGKELRARIWTSLSRMLLIIECRCDGLEPRDLWLRVHRHRDIVKAGPPLPAPFMGNWELGDDFAQMDMPDCCQTDSGFGITQDFPPDPTFPGGFRVAVMAIPDSGRWEVSKIRGEMGLGTPYWAPKEGRLDHGLVKLYSPINQTTGCASTARCFDLPSRFSIYATAASTQDSPEPVCWASSTLQDALRRGIEELAREQGELMESCSRGPARAAAAVGDACLSAPELVRPRLRRIGGYYGDVPLCSVSSTKFCFQDGSPWHGDFHLNEIRAEGMLTLGQFEELLPYCEMVRTLLPQARENARDVYDLPGAMYPLVHFPLRCRGITHANLTWEQDMGIDGLVTKPLWLYYRYTGDAGFLENVAYPVLADCAEFCRSYLSEGSDGRLHLVPTVSPEHWGLTKNFERNRDCTSALTLTSYLLRAASNAAGILDENRKLARLWREAAERLAPYPTYQTPNGPVWVDVQDAPPIEYNIPVPLSPVFWGDDVGLDSTGKTLEMAMRTLDQIRVWAPHSSYLDSCIRPRLGLYRPGAQIGPENLLLSYQSLRIFPAVPEDRPVKMRVFAAEGGFRVSAAKKPGRGIEGIEILSTLGGPCHLANPWPGFGILVKVGGRELGAFEGEHVTFETAKGCTYSLTEMKGEASGRARTGSARRSRTAPTRS